MWRALVFCVSFALCAAISPAVDGQTLSRMRNEVRSGGDGSSSSSNDDEKEKKKKKKRARVRPTTIITMMMMMKVHLMNWERRS